MASSRAFLSNPHTLAQFARRAGISEGRARALHGDGKLPAPDSADADGRPLWADTTVDGWCQTTNRPVQGEALWIFRVPEASEPAPEMFHGLVDFEDLWGRPHQVHAIVWDTPHGHIVYVMPLVGDSLEDYGAAKRDLARAALHLVQPAFWADALVCTFTSVDLPYSSQDTVAYQYYNFDVFRLTPHQADAPQRQPRRLRLFGSTADPVPSPARRPSGEVGEGSIIMVPVIARAIGRPVPLWLRGTCTPENVRRVRAYRDTVTVPDTVSDWPAARSRLEQALAWGMRETYPAAFAALAADTMQTLHDVVRQLHLLPDSGTGWQLATRPAAPDVPFALERALHAPAPELPLDSVIDELHALHEAEGALPATAAYGEAAERALETLAYTVAEQRPDAVPERIFAHDWPQQGPVADLLMDHLTRIEDQDAVLGGVPTAMTRRLQRLLAPWGQDRATGIYADQQGRYVLTLRSNLEQEPPILLAEWPTAVPTGWTPETVIAADRGHGAAGVFALTPTPDGQMTIDPVPFDPRSGPSFAYGYQGGSPTTLYMALLRCVLGGPVHDPADQLFDDYHRENSQLWKAIRTTSGHLRLPWPQVQEWAQADLTPR